MWAMLDSSSISVVLQTYRPERDALLKLLAGLSADEWTQPTECPAYPVKGIATHVLGDDLSLLSRQRDGAVQGLVYMTDELPGADFRTLLDAFNDRWVTTARFMSPLLLIELLRLTGEWTAAYYESVDPDAPGEPVGLFGASRDSSSPFWQAIAREYLERWIHHSQIRRALGLRSLADAQFLRTWDRGGRRNSPDGACRTNRSQGGLGLRADRARPGTAGRRHPDPRLYHRVGPTARNWARGVGRLRCSGDRQTMSRSCSA